MKNIIPTEMTPYLASKNQKFSEVGVLVDLVISKQSPSLLICGQSGIGKSRLVKDRLVSANLLEGFDYRVVKGHGSALGLYSLLYECRSMCLILDDADSLFQDPKGVNVLKAALDSYDQRRISWQSPSAKQMDVPLSFDFTGSVIFISNLSMNEMDPAVLSRSLHCNLELTPDEILATMYDVLPVIDDKVSMPIREGVLKFIAHNRQQLFETGKFNLRTLINGIRIRSSGEGNWRGMILKYA